MIHTKIIKCKGKLVARAVCFISLAITLTFGRLSAEIPRKFTNFHLATNFAAYYLPEDMVEDGFTKHTIYRAVDIKIYVPVFIFSEIFADLPKAVFLANKYAKQKYEIEPIPNPIKSSYPCYGAFDGYKTQAEIYPLFEETNISSSHFKYYCQGEYDTFITLEGFFFMDIKIKKVGTYSHLHIDAYFQLSNWFLATLAYALMSSKSFRDRIEKIVDATVSNMVAVGKRTAYYYYYREKIKR